MDQVIQITLPKSRSARKEVLNFLQAKGLIASDQLNQQGISIESSHIKQTGSFSEKWAGAFEPSDKSDARYKALAEKYL